MCSSDLCECVGVRLRGRMRECACGLRCILTDNNYSSTLVLRLGRDARDGRGVVVVVMVVAAVGDGGVVVVGVVAVAVSIAALAAGSAVAVGGVLLEAVGWRLPPPMV